MLPKIRVVKRTNILIVCPPLVLPRFTLSLSLLRWLTTGSFAGAAAAESASVFSGALSGLYNTTRKTDQGVGFKHAITVAKRITFALLFQPPTQMAETILMSGIKELEQITTTIQGGFSLQFTNRYWNTHTKYVHALLPPTLLLFYYGAPCKDHILTLMYYTLVQC